MVVIDLEVELWCPEPFNLEDADEAVWKRLGRYCSKMLDRTIGRGLQLLRTSEFENANELAESIERTLGPWHTRLGAKMLHAFSPSHYRSEDVIYMENMLEEILRQQCKAAGLPVKAVKNDYACDLENDRHSASASVTLSLLDAQKYIHENYPAHAAAIDSKISAKVEELRREGLSDAEIERKLSVTGVNITIKMDVEKKWEDEYEERQSARMRYSLSLDGEECFAQPGKAEMTGKGKPDQAYAVFACACGGDNAKGAKMREAMEMCERKSVRLNGKRLVARLYGFFFDKTRDNIMAWAVIPAVMFAFGETAAVGIAVGAACFIAKKTAESAVEFVKKGLDLLGRSVTETCRLVFNLGRADMTPAMAFAGYGKALISKPNMRDMGEMLEEASDGMAVSIFFANCHFQTQKWWNIGKETGRMKREKLSEQAELLREKIRNGAEKKISFEM